MQHFQKICLTRLAIPAETEKIKPMSLNLKTGRFDNLFFLILRDRPHPDQ